MSYIFSLFASFLAFLPMFNCLSVEHAPSTEFPKLLSAQKIWDDARHSAFTDLIRFQNKWFCVFRESDEHVGGRNGDIRLIESLDGEVWRSVAVFSQPGIDLRDPKLSITPDNRLMLLVGGTQYSQEGVYLSSQPRVAFSNDGDH